MRLSELRGDALAAVLLQLAVPLEHLSRRQECDELLHMIADGVSGGRLRRRAARLLPDAGDEIMLLAAVLLPEEALMQPEEALLRLAQTADAELLSFFGCAAVRVRVLCCGR